MRVCVRACVRACVSFCLSVSEYTYTSVFPVKKSYSTLLKKHIVNTLNAITIIKKHHVDDLYTSETERPNLYRSETERPNSQ